LAIVTPAKFKGKEAFYEKMLRIFVKDPLPQQWLSFDQAAADVENTKKLVHTIKGTAGNLDIADVYQAALRFETSLREGAPDKELYQALIDACDAVKKSLPPA
jgi:HPt (histidine-containing phosphotransfer) domain-containing protein